MQIVLVAAMARNRVIGSGNTMPWHLPADLAHFKTITMGKPLIMGRKTFDSIGRPLPGRRNIVISRQKQLALPGAEVASSLEDALALVNDVEQVMVIGGGAIYQLAMPIATRMELTFIDADIEGDTQFPEWDDQQWDVVAAHEHSSDGRNLYSYRFVSYLKRA